MADSPMIQARPSRPRAVRVWFSLRERAAACLSIVTICLAAVATIACDGPEAASPPSRAASSAVSPSSAAPSADAPDAPRPASRPRIVVLGDSLSAGLGISPDQAFPAVLQQKIDAQRLNFEVVNAGVSGDTTAGGLRRLDWALDGDVRIMILELGANDGLRGLSVDEMRANLSRIIERAQARRITVLLCGMEAPPNFGPAYTAEFRAAFRAVAAKHDVALVPFLLDGVAGREGLNQADGIHPNVAGAQRVAETVWASLQPILRERTSTS